MGGVETPASFFHRPARGFTGICHSWGTVFVLGDFHTALRAGEKVPVRTCVGCRRRQAQAGLRRFVRRVDGWQADAGRRSEGRGVYLCSSACAERVAKNKRYPGLSREALVQW